MRSPFFHKLKLFILLKILILLLLAINCDLVNATPVINVNKSLLHGNLSYPICLTEFPLLMEEIKLKMPAVQSIIGAVLNGSFTGKTYQKLSYFADTYPNRIAGSDNAEDSIDFLEGQMKSFGFQNVKMEEVPDAPNWQRGNEICKLMSPESKDLDIIGLGMSAPTPPAGFILEAIVFNSYKELLGNLSKVSGKLVVSNYCGPPSNPTSTENNGYPEAVAAGATAMLYKSAATFSLQSNHARRATLYYDGKSKQIPIALLTIEDASYLSRLSGRGENLTIYLNMQSKNRTRASRNLFGDLPGQNKSEEVVLVTAHTDSWDVGPGVQDDAFGIYLALHIAPLLKSLGLTPRRTIRIGLWTAEEYGFIGSHHYVQTHTSELGQISLALEADNGCLLANGFMFHGSPELACTLQGILNMLNGVSRSLLIYTDTFLTDLHEFQNVSIPVVGFNGNDGRYSWFHHTKADSIDSTNSTVIDKCLAAWAVTAYVFADLTNMITREQ